MKLKSENYKGIAIRIVKNVLGGRNVYEATAWIRGKTYRVVEPTREIAVGKIKKIINFYHR